MTSEAKISELYQDIKFADESKTTQILIMKLDCMEKRIKELENKLRGAK